MENRRMVIAIALSVLVWVGWIAATRGCAPPPVAPKDGTPADGVPKDGTPKDGTNGTAPPAAPGAQPGAPPGTPAAPEADPDQPAEGTTPPAPEEATLRNDRLEVTFTNQGAAISSIRLLREYEPDKKTPLDLVVPADPALLMGQIDTQHLTPSGGAPGGADRKEDPPGLLRSSAWTRDAAAEAKTDESDVVYTYASRSGRTWRKRWALPSGDRYDVRLEITLEGGGAGAVPVRLLASSNLLREPTTGATFMYPNSALVRIHPMNEPDSRPDGFAIQDVSGKRVELLGERSHYFLVGLFNETEDDAARPFTKVWATGEEAARRDAARARLREWFLAERKRPVTKDDGLERRIEEAILSTHHTWAIAEVPGDGKPLTASFYAGPIDRATLARTPYEAVEPVIAYPAAFDFVAKGLLWIYDLWRNLFGSAGLAVILMTLVVRGALMPISIRNQLGMRRYGRRVAKLKPKVDELRKKYAKNPQKLREEQMKLYKEHGVGFPTGCLMMFIQLPIFFALFSSLRAEYTLRNESFLWIPDLAGPDRLFDLPFAIDLPMIGAIHSLNLLPILYIALTVWQTHQMPKPIDEQQAQQMKMMKWMPIVFAVVLYNYTAALALYMIVSSALAIAESKIVKRRDAREIAVAA